MMLLGRKIKQEKRSDWALILEKPQDAIAKNRATEKLSRTFELPTEDAKDLLENTPLILLDELSHEMAAQIKHYFSEAKVGCFLTMDTTTKRKCFRAVWPKELNLAGLIGQAAAPNGQSVETNGASSIHEEVSTSTPREKSETQEEIDLRSEVASHRDLTSEKNDVEVGQLKTLVLDLQKENDALRSQLEELETKMQTRTREFAAGQFEKHKLEQVDLEDAKNQLKHYRSEYDRTQALLKVAEERIRNDEQSFREAGGQSSQMRDENMHLAARIKELELDIKSQKELWERRTLEETQGVSQKLGSQVEELRLDFERTRELLESTQLELKKSKDEIIRWENESRVSRELTLTQESKVLELERAMKARQIAWESHTVREAQAITAELKKERDEIRPKLDQAQAMLVRSESERDRFKSELIHAQTSVKNLEEENHNLMTRAVDFEQKIKAKKVAWESKAVADANAKIEELEPALAHFKEAYERAQTSLGRAEGEVGKLRMQVRDFESRIKELEPAFAHSKEMHEHAQTLLLRTEEEAKKLRMQVRDFEVQANRSREEVAALKQNLGDAQISVARTIHEAEDLKRLLSESQTNGVRLKQDYERLKVDSEGQLGMAQRTLEEWKRKATDWNEAFDRVSKENEFLRTSQAEEIEALRVKNRELSIQLTQAQRQVKDFLSQVEQQELVQKRTKIANELVERENKLKNLVERQRNLEGELRKKEEELKSALTDQESVEREILKVKQTQKYMQEQLKQRSKMRMMGRPKLADSETASEEDVLEEDLTRENE